MNISELLVGNIQDEEFDVDCEASSLSGVCTVAEFLEKYQSKCTSFDEEAFKKQLDYLDKVLKV
ncbi:MAG: hypothetical protein E7Z87_06490 [Cyanobacteria bacterium SIG26]|nr:hypothetical protein [Cyanobacteria bacterium SIG26]